MGQYPTDEELLQMIAEVDDDGSNEIEFSEFLKVPKPIEDPHRLPGD